MRQKLEVYFNFAAPKTNWRTDIFAGLTTFITMAYIIVVNPAILGKAGLTIPAVTAATAPALIVVGSPMLYALGEIDWKNAMIAFPAFLTLVLIPLTTSIADGLGFGIIAWAALRLFTGRISRRDWLLCALALLFLARFIYVGGT
jgi:xanthine/uracil/vitamin C permease (AzgA family)